MLKKELKGGRQQETCYLLTLSPSWYQRLTVGAVCNRSSKI